VVKERYLINEAAKEVHVESHVLRYWEEELELPIKRNEQGHRIYTQEDIDRFIAIKNLKDQGLQLKAVRTVLDQIHNDNGGEEDMKADNPFAQKQLTKITKLGEAKMAAIKNSEDAKWNERFGRKHEAATTTEEGTTNSEQEGRIDMKNMIEIKEMRSLSDKSDYAQDSRLPEAGQAQTLRLQYLFQKLIKDAVAANNKEMADQLVERITENVKGDLCKELDYQFRLMEERDEERVNSRHELEDQRNEEYYKRIDELLRQYRGKGGKLKDKNKEKNKEKEKTIEFPNSKEKGEQKVKKEFHLFRKAVEAK